MDGVCGYVHIFHPPTKKLLLDPQLSLIGIQPWELNSDKLWMTRSQYQTFGNNVVRTQTNGDEGLLICCHIFLHGL
jgi:hypothetical protein